MNEISSTFKLSFCSSLATWSTSLVSTIAAFTTEVSMFCNLLYVVRAFGNNKSHTSWLHFTTESPSQFAGLAFQHLSYFNIVANCSPSMPLRQRSVTLFAKTGIMSLSVTSCPLNLFARDENLLSSTVSILFESCLFFLLLEHGTDNPLFPGPQPTDKHQYFLFWTVHVLFKSCQ